MDFEFATDYLLRLFFNKVRPVNPTLLEIGLGCGNYSFLWAKPLGFRCLAVEPLPVESLTILAKQQGVELISAAVGAKSGECPIYHGVLYGNHLPDISSMNPAWWGVGKQRTIVRCFSLPELCQKYVVNAIDILKVDTEGSEFQILSTLIDLPAPSLPRIISFEYGGGGQPLSSRSGGWAPEFFDGTCKILQIASELGYCACIVLETTRILPFLKTGIKNSIAQDIFDPSFLVGNIFLIRDSDDADLFVSLIARSRWRLIVNEGFRRWKNMLTSLTVFVLKLRRVKHRLLTLKSKS